MSDGPYRENQKPTDKFNLVVTLYFKSGRVLSYSKNDILAEALSVAKRDELDKYFRSVKEGYSAEYLTPRITETSRNSVVTLTLPTSTFAVYPVENETENTEYFLVSEIESVHFATTNVQQEDENRKQSEDVRKQHRMRT